MILPIISSFEFSSFKSKKCVDVSSVLITGNTSKLFKIKSSAKSIMIVFSISSDHSLLTKNLYNFLT
jgi:hypothetical protein